MEEETKLNCTWFCPKIGYTVPNKIANWQSKNLKKMKNHIQNPKEKRMLDDFKMIFFISIINQQNKTQK